MHIREQERIPITCFITIAADSVFYIVSVFKSIVTTIRTTSSHFTTDNLQCMYMQYQWHYWSVINTIPFKRENINCFKWFYSSTQIYLYVLNVIHDNALNVLLFAITVKWTTSNKCRKQEGNKMYSKSLPTSANEIRSMK